MKLRLNFVSNSSSSSFVLDKEGMTKEQLDRFRELVRQANDDGGADGRIYESSTHFHGKVSILNTAIPAFVKEHKLSAEFDMLEEV